MARLKSWWRLKQIRHRDAVVLSVVSSAFLLAGQVPLQEGLYATYLAPVAQQPLLFLAKAVLLILAYTTYFGGILVLMGGVNFLWNRVGRGRFLVSLGIGVSLLLLLKQLALAILLTGSPMAVILVFTTGLSGIGMLLGFVSYTLMGEYALMLKKHARTVWRRWRKAHRPTRRNGRSRSAPRLRAS